MFLELRFEFAEGLLAAGANVRRSAGGVQGLHGKSESGGESVFSAARILRKCAAQLHGIGIIGFQ